MTFPTPPLAWPRIALLTIGDGRDDLLDATLASLGDQLGADLPHVQRARFAELDLGARAWTRSSSITRGAGPGPFVTYCHVDDRHHELGFGGAIAAGWRGLLDQEVTFDYVLHVEEDWRFDARVDLTGMAMLLDLQPHLAQVALKRNAVNADERRAGGLVEQWPAEYADRFIDAGYLPAPVAVDDGALVEVKTQRVHWLEHALFFTTNPSLYRRELMIPGWPAGERSEQQQTANLLAQGARFAFWGRRDDPPAVWHLGDDRRQGTGY